MTFKNKSFLLGISFIVYAQALIAQTYCLKYDITIVGNAIEVKLSMVANGTMFNLGAGNVQFKYNKAALMNPVLKRNALTTNALYDGMTLTQPHPPTFAKTNDGLISFNFDYKGVSGNGLPISLLDAGTELAVIRFDLKDTKLAPNIRPYDNGTKGTVIYNDDTHNPLLIQTTGNCPNYNPLNSEKEVKIKGYPSLMLRSNAFFTLEVPDFESANRQDYQIVTVLGKQVMSGKTAAQIELHVSHLAAGAYFVKVGTEQIKFVIQ